MQQKNTNIVKEKYEDGCEEEFKNMRKNMKNSVRNTKNNAKGV